MAVLPKLAPLHKYNRLKVNYSFSKTIRSGYMLRGRYMICYILPRKYGPLRLGVTCTKQAPNAVWRNYYKRRLRQAYQANADLINSLNLGPCNCVLLAKHFPEKISALAYCDDLAAILQNSSLHAKINR